MSKITGNSTIEDESELPVTSEKTAGKSKEDLAKYNKNINRKVLSKSDWSLKRQEDLKYTTGKSQ